MAWNDRLRSSNANSPLNRKANARRRKAFGRRLALELLEDRTLLSGASFDGAIFADLNGDWVRDADELGVPELTVFLDQNENGELDPSETYTTTDADGRYGFSGLEYGSQVIAFVPPNGMEEILALSVDGGYDVSELTSFAHHTWMPLHDEHYLTTFEDTEGYHRSWFGSGPFRDSGTRNIYYDYRDAVVDESYHLHGTPPFDLSVHLHVTVVENEITPVQMAMAELAMRGWTAMTLGKLNFVYNTSAPLSDIINIGTGDIQAAFDAPGSAIGFGGYKPLDVDMGGEQNYLISKGFAWQSSARAWTDAFYFDVAAQEIGHALGLGHTDNLDKDPSPIMDQGKLSPHFTNIDRRHIRSLYRTGSQSSRPTLSFSGPSVLTDAQTTSWTLSDPYDILLNATATLSKVNPLETQNFSPVRGGLSLIDSSTWNGSFDFYINGVGTLPASFLIKIEAEDVFDPHDFRNQVFKRTVTVIDDDSQPPSIAIEPSMDAGLGFFSGAVRVFDSDPRLFSWNVFDPSGLQYVNVGVTGPSGQLLNDSSATGAFDFTSFGLGRYTLSITAGDNDNDRLFGDSEFGSSVRAVEVIDDDKLAPVITFTADDGTLLLGSNRSESHGLTNSIAWNIYDASGVSRVEVALFRDDELLDQFQAAALDRVYLDGYGLGTFRVELSATDGDTDGWVGDQLTATGSASLTVTNDPPSLFAGGPYLVEEGELLALDAIGSDVDPGDTESLVYAWDLDGDGLFDDADGSRPVITWEESVAAGLADDGTYTVRGRVTDSFGATADATATVTVVNGPPQVESILSDPFIDENTSLIVTGQFSDPSPLDTHSVLVFWGDGTNSPAVVNAVDRTFTASHLYADDDPTATPFDEYVVQVEVTDDDGGTNPYRSRTLRVETDSVGGIELPSFPLSLPPGVSGLLESARVLVDPQEVISSSAAAQVFDHNHFVNYPPSGPFDLKAVATSTVSAVGEHDHSFNVPSQTKTFSGSFYPMLASDSPYALASTWEVVDPGTGLPTGQDHDHTPGDVTFTTSTTFTYLPNFFTTLNTDFSYGSPRNTQRNGNAHPHGGTTLHLTHPQKNQKGSLIVNSVNSPVTAFNAKFRLYMGGGSGADGFSFGYGPLSNGSLFGEEGPSGRKGLWVTFDTYGSDIGITVFFNGSLVKHRALPKSYLRTPRNENIEINIDEGGNLTIYQRFLDDATGLWRVTVPGWNAQSSQASWRFGMGARTGAATDYHEIDRLSIKAKYPLTYTVSTSSVNSYVLPPFTANGTLQKAVVTLDAGSEITSITDGGQFLHNHDFGLDVAPFSFATVTSADGAAGEDHTHAVDLAPVELDVTSQADLRGFFLQEASVVLPQPGSGSSLTLSHAHELDQGTVPFHSTVDFTYDVASTVVRVRNINPVITALSLPASTVENSTVQLTGQFDDLGSGDTHVVQIDWGDGTTDELSVPYGQRLFAASHVYADDSPSGSAADTYQVGVRVLDDDGGESTATLAITVLNELPVLTLAAALEVAEGSVFDLPSAVFSDRGLLDTHTAVVDWGDGQTSIATVSQGTGAGVVSDQHVYGDEGDYNVRVTLRDDDTGEASQAATVSVLNVAPTIDSLWVEGPVIEGAGLTLRASVTDPGNDVLTYTWDFGDGTPTESSVDLDSVNHLYANEGTYTVTLSVDDGDGGLTSRSLTAVIPDLSTGLMIAGPTEVIEGVAYPLTLSALTALAASSIDSWFVDWGDGATNTYLTGDVPSDGVVMHTYANGTVNYIVRVDVNKTAGGVSTVGSLPVTVVNAPPEILSLNSHVVYREGEVQPHSALAIDSGDDPLTYTWDFGDGSPTESGLDLRNVEYKYTDDGVFFLTVTVDDGDGGVAVRSVPVVTTNVAPTIVLTGDAQTAEGQAYELTLGGISDPGQDTVSGWTVDWGDGRTDTYDQAGIVTHAYADGPQSHVIRVALEDEDGIHDNAGQLAVSVMNAAPEILAISGDARGDEGQRISLSANVVDPAGPYDVLNYLWDFGDGTAVVEGINRADVRHIYTDNGVYTTTLTVTDEDGDTAVSAFEVIVDNVAPTSILSGPATAIEAQPYVIKFGSVIDPGDDTVTQWIVDWGDGGQDVLVDPIAASHVYEDGPAQYDIVLTLVDEDGNHVGAGSSVVDVLNAPPVLTSLTGDTEGFEGGSFAFQASASDPAGDQDVLTYQWNFGDGSPVESGVGLAQPAHTYADDGVYILSLIVDDSEGGSDSRSLRVTVQDVAPTIVLAGAATVGEGDTYELTLGEITDPGDDTVTQWLVNWGDGSSNQYSAGGVVTHQFGDGPATLAIRATLIDEDGQHFDAGQRDVAVENSPPIITNVTSSPDTREGDLVVFSATAEDPAGDLDTLTFIWDFGDGSPLESGVGLDQPAHTYADDGTYQVRVTVADEDGGQASREFEHSVANVAPAIDLSGSAGVNEATPYELRLGPITDPGQDTVTAWIVAWGDGQQATYDSTQLSSSSGVVSHTYPDGPANPTITVSLVDEDGTHVAGQYAVVVRNADPQIVAIGGDTEGDEGSSFQYTAVATDPAGSEDTLTYTWDFGDGSNPVSGIDLTDVTHVFRDDGVFSANLTVTDEDGGEVSGWFDVQVDNVAPVLGALTGATIDENGFAHVTGTITDPSNQDTFDLAIDWGEGTPVTYSYPAGTTSFDESHQYLDDNPSGTPSDLYTIGVTLTDDDTGTDIGSTTTTVTNVAPAITVTSTNAPITDKAVEGEDVTLTLEFDDPGTLDVHTVTIDWDDSSGDQVMVLPVGQRTLTVDHAFQEGGIFTISVAVEDDDTGSDDAPTTAVVTGVRITEAGELQIIGTSEADTVEVELVGDDDDDDGGPSTIRVEASFLTNVPKIDDDNDDDYYYYDDDDGLRRFRDFDPNEVSGILIVLGDGNDYAKISEGVHINSIVDGGVGADTLRGGGGDDILLGRQGEDWLYGNGGDDILIGGDGRDILFGNSDDDDDNEDYRQSASDLLTGSIFDANPTDDADPTVDFLDDIRALSEIAKEWTSGKLLTERADNVTGDNPQPGRLNDDSFLRLGETLFDDGDQDELVGNSWDDWLLPLGRDRVIHQFGDDDDGDDDD